MVATVLTPRLIRYNLLVNICHDNLHDGVYAEEEDQGANEAHQYQMPYAGFKIFFVIFPALDADEHGDAAQYGFEQSWRFLYFFLI